jgi:hypothetical protein
MSRLPGIGRDGRAEEIAASTTRRRPTTEAPRPVVVTATTRGLPAPTWIRDRHGEARALDPRLKVLAELRAAR